MESVHWYRVPGRAFILGADSAAGSLVGNRILIAESEIYDGPLVRHEILHALLGMPGHPRAQFLGSCASLVYCIGSCLRDAGPWQAPGPYIRASSDSLELRVDAEANTDGTDRWLSVWVRAHNPRNQAVLVLAPGDTQRVQSTFSYALWGPFGNHVGAVESGVVTLDREPLFFAPYETKQWLFEFLVSQSLSQDAVPMRIPSGTYQVWGGYAHHWMSKGGVTIVIADSK